MSNDLEPGKQISREPEPDTSSTSTYFGWQVMWAAFVVATFGWGVGFYGPPIFLHTIVSKHEWSLGLVSTAITSHFLLGAFLVAQMPSLYRRFGVSDVTKFSAVSTALGIMLWSNASAPWHLFAASLVSGVGWAGTGALAINMIVSPWFDRRRPAALSTAYNGASLGGIVFSPLWLFLIDLAGFAWAAFGIGLLMIVVLWSLSNRYFRLSPGDLGLFPDGETSHASQTETTDSRIPERPGKALWTSRGFQTYIGGFTIGLFVQVGIIAHLVSLLIPAMGAGAAGLAAGLATVCAIIGRTLSGWLMPAHGNRRYIAAGTYCIQACGCFVFVLAGGQSIPLLWAGVILFGFGIGNVTSLPPLIAQKEFATPDVPRAIALGTAIGQAAYAFAPAAFGLIRIWSSSEAAATNPDVPAFFAVAAALQILAAVIYLLGTEKPENCR